MSLISPGDSALSLSRHSRPNPTFTPPKDLEKTRSLRKHYRSLLEGKSKINYPEDAILFIEALHYYSPDRCVESLVSSPHGLDAVRSCVQIDLSPVFIQAHTLVLVSYLSDPSIAALADGHFLGEVLDAILSPPTFWQALVAAFFGGFLHGGSLLPFAWLLCDVATSSGNRENDYNYISDVRAVLEQGSLYTAASADVRYLAFKAHQAVYPLSTPGMVEQLVRTGERAASDLATSRDVSGCPSPERVLFNAQDCELDRRSHLNLELNRMRWERQSTYNQQLREIKDQVEQAQRVMQQIIDEERNLDKLAQEVNNLKNLQDAVKRKQESKLSQVAVAVASRAPTPPLADHRPLQRLPSKARQEWEHMKRAEGAQSPALDDLMEMTGLEEVKEAFLMMQNMVDAKMRQNVSLQGERWGASLLGNPGTGKTTVARLYGKFLTSVGAIAGTRFEETTGAKLAHLGVSGCESLIANMLESGGGVLFVDEAYQLTSGKNQGGGAVLDFLLAEIENLVGKIVFVIAGYDSDMEAFFAHNTGLRSRFPHQLRFSDYTDEEIHYILQYKIDKRYNGTMRCEGGLSGPYCRQVAERIGRGRGQPGFGNARTVENEVVSILQRQATRLARERREGLKPDDLFLNKEDLLGAEVAVPATDEEEAGRNGLKQADRGRRPGEMKRIYSMRAVKGALLSLVGAAESEKEPHRRRASSR
ncbi:hypothetical protein MCOR25_006477 [Pyricularia grisea]|uniref:AAA+ ATPase domain-containing protein n=1 Tax=Pyricularia grisea TaxID=148305 RepID=A0A6P8AND0_PYRGI|nr:uncharacterized protein PgNI_11549 [Pyricularia grisea]KAI6361572.1 hypothetical protein MCOR25_006477 [Pyricularia grisea]TLD03531.1 hypothetical protein PgNI_11549 [Pyricularia grisea]